MKIKLAKYLWLNIYFLLGLLVLVEILFAYIFWHTHIGMQKILLYEFFCIILYVAFFDFSVYVLAQYDNHGNDTCGLEDYYTYQVQGFGKAGTGYVGDYTKRTYPNTFDFSDQQ